jgi:hypothetical protein
MTKSTSDSSKSSKRKGQSCPPQQHPLHPIAKPLALTHSNTTGTRSVSTLTPAQLARKRANDREAQRAIRARTKEHIENLERELEELRSVSSRDDTVQDLLRRNRALEDELHRLRESMGIASNGPRNYYQPCMSYTRINLFFSFPTWQQQAADSYLQHTTTAQRRELQLLAL